MEPNPIGLGEVTSEVIATLEAARLNGAESDRTRRAVTFALAFALSLLVSMEPNPIGLGERGHRRSEVGRSRSVSMEPNPIGLGEEVPVQRSPLN